MWFAVVVDRAEGSPGPPSRVHVLPPSTTAVDRRRSTAFSIPSPADRQEHLPTFRCRPQPSDVLPPPRETWCLVPLGIATNGALRRHLRLEPGARIEYFTASQAEEGVSKMASIMSCLSPRDININTFRFTRRTWVHDLGSQVNTGDIILFSSKHNASYITKFFTQSGASLPVAPHLAPYPHLAPCRVSLVQGGTTLRWS